MERGLCKHNYSLIKDGECQFYLQEGGQPNESRMVDGTAAQPGRVQAAGFGKSAQSVKWHHQIVGEGKGIDFQFDDDIGDTGSGFRPARKVITCQLAAQRLEPSRPRSRILKINLDNLSGKGNKYQKG